MPKSSGVYLEGGAGMGLNSDHMKVKFDDFSKWFGGQVGLGYKVNMFFGVQADLLRYPDFTLSGTETSTGNWGYDIVAKAIMPFDNGVNIFAKGGWVRLNQKLAGATDTTLNKKHTQHGYTFGVGTSLYTDQSLGFTLQGNMTTKEKTIPEQFLITLGVTYIF